MATKRWKGGAWEYKVQRAGVLPRAVYLRFDDEAEGDVYVRRLEALLDRGVVPDELVDRKRPSTLLRDGVRAYLAAQHVSDSDREYLRIVRDRMPAGLELRAVTFAWATEWITRLKREDNLSPSTIRHHVGSLARALDWIAAKGDLPLNPLRLLPKGYATYTPEDGREATRNEGFVKADTERDRRLHAGEDEAIREIMHGAKPKGRQRPLEMRHGDRLELLYDMALESAMRMREMYTIDVAQVDIKRRTIFLDKTKNGDKRQVPITSVLRARLKASMPASGLLFPWWDGRDESLKATTTLLSRQFDRIFSAAGCADLHFHDLRHEATSRLFERTKLSDLEIAKITGHRNLRSLSRYANLRASNLAARLW